MLNYKVVSLLYFTPLQNPIQENLLQNMAPRITKYSCMKN